jgi:hypothetical protein
MHRREIELDDDSEMEIDESPLVLYPFRGSSNGSILKNSGLPPNQAYRTKSKKHEPADLSPY